MERTQTSQAFYTQAALYGRQFLVNDSAVEFYRREAKRPGGCALERGG